MSGPSVRFRAAFPRRARREKREVKPATRLARQLALAHHLEGLVEGGAVPNYATVARAIGLTRARLSQLTSLTLLSPDIQDAILVGELDATARGIRPVLREVEWEEQGRRLGGVLPRQRG